MKAIVFACRRRAGAQGVLASVPAEFDKEASAAATAPLPRYFRGLSRMIR